MLTTEERAIKARWAAATRGPWTMVVYAPVGAAVERPGRGRFFLGVTADGRPDVDDAWAIAAAPADIAALLATVESLRAKLAEREAEVKEAVRMIAAVDKNDPIHHGEDTYQTSHPDCRACVFLARHGGA